MHTIQEKLFAAALAVVVLVALFALATMSQTCTKSASTESQKITCSGA